MRLHAPPPALAIYKGFATIMSPNYVLTASPLDEVLLMKLMLAFGTILYILALANSFPELLVHLPDYSLSNLTSPLYVHYTKIYGHSIQCLLHFKTGELL